MAIGCGISFYFLVIGGDLAECDVMCFSALQVWGKIPNVSPFLEDVSPFFQSVETNKIK